MSYKKMTDEVYNELYDYYNKGMTLREILIKFEDLSPNNLLKIKDTYFRIFTQDIGLFRENIVCYNIVETDMGQHYLDYLVKQNRRDMYIVKTLNKKTFKDYLGERTIFVYNFTGDGSNYTALRYMFDDMVRTAYYAKTRIPSVWREVQFTSPYSPEDLYYRMEKDKYDETLGVNGFLWRINYVIFHYKLEISGKVIYRKYKIPMKSYTTFEDIKAQAIKSDPEYAAYLETLKLI